MNITLKTPVKGHYLNVMKAFDRKLFEELLPPIGKTEIVQFTGSTQGDIVHIRFVSPIRSEWISDIVENEITDKKAWFVDIGATIPWPLATWKHYHIVEKVDNDNSMIIDDMNFTGRNSLLTLLLYPAIYLGFFPRKRIYKKYFDQLYNNNFNEERI